MGKKKTFLVDNSPVDVEEQDVNDFLKYNKGAVEARSYIVGKDTVDVALTDVADFEANVKNAKPLYGEEPKQVDPYAPKPVNFGKTTSVSPIVPEQPKTVTNDQKNRAKNYGDVVGQIKNMQSELTTINNREDSENSSIFLSAESDKQKAELEKNIALYNKAISTNVAQHTKDLYEKWDKEITDITPYTTTASVGGVTVHDTEKTFAEADKLAKEYGQEGTDFNTFVKLAFSQYVENRISQPTIDKYANEAFKEITQIDKSIPETAQEDFEQGFKERGTIIGKAKAEMDVVANTVKAEYAPEKEQLKQDATHISEDFWKDTQQYEMDYTAMQWQLNNEYQQGKVSREQYEAASAQAHETYKAGFEERQKESIQASAILAKTERDINLKIQRTYNQRRDMLIRSYDNSLQEAAKKYSAKYKSSPEFEANVKKAYDIAYARYSKERESALKQDMDMKGVVGMGTNTAWGMKNFGLAVTESIGNSIRSHGIMWNNASMISIGDEMATNIQLPESKIRTDQIMSDLFSYRGLLTAGQITGSGLPGIVVGAASAAVGNVAGMSQGLVAAVGGVIALGQETDDMATAMYAETMAETGNAATASEKAKQIVKGQSIMIIPSILHMTSFMKGINFGIKNKTLSYAAKATGELGTNIFEENYQNPMEEAVRKKGNWTMMGEYITKQGIIETTVNTLPMLGQTLMTTRADGEVKGVDIKVQADKFISDNKLSEILANRGDSFAQKELNDIQTVMGDNFALTTVQQMYTQGLIDDKKLNSLTAAVATNNQITKQIEGLKLNPEQGLIYRALVHKQTEAANGMADATSDVEKNYFATQEQNISSQLKLLAEGKDADVLMVTFPNGSQHILTTAEANQMLTDPDFIEQVKQGKAVDIKGYGKGAAEIKANLSKLEDMLVKEKEDKATQEAQSTLDNNVTQTETKPKTAEERAAAILAQVKRKPKTEAEALQAELKTVSDQEERTNIGEQITLHETKAQHEGKVKEIADKIVNLSENGKVVENLDKINALAADKKKIEESISDIENQIKTKQNERETKNKGREKASLLKEKTWHDLAKDDRITVNGVGASVSGVNQNMNGAVHSIDFTLDDGTKGVATILGNDILDANGKPLLIKNEVIQSEKAAPAPSEPKTTSDKKQTEPIEEEKNPSLIDYENERVKYNGEVGYIRVDEGGKITFENGTVIKELIGDEKVTPYRIAVKGNNVNINGDNFEIVSVNKDGNDNVVSVSLKNEKGVMITKRDSELALDIAIQQSQEAFNAKNNVTVEEQDKVVKETFNSHFGLSISEITETMPEVVVDAIVLMDNDIVALAPDEIQLMLLEASQWAEGAIKKIEKTDATKAQKKEAIGKLKKFNKDLNKHYGKVDKQKQSKTNDASKGEATKGDGQTQQKEVETTSDNQKPTESGSVGVGGDVPALKDSKGDITYYSGRQSDNNDINRMGGKYNGVYFTPDIEQAEAYSAGKIIKGTIHPQKVFDFTEQIYKPRSEGESNKYIEAWEKDKKELGEDRMAHEHIGTNLYNQLIKDGYDVGVLDAKNLDTKRWGNTFNELVVLKNLDKIFKEQSLKETTKAETKVTSDNQKPTEVTSDKKSIEKVKVKDLEVGDEVVLKGKEGTWKVAKKTKDGVDLSHTTKQGSMFKGADDGDIEGKVVNRSENAVNGIKSAWESNIEALVNPETGLAAVIGRIVDETQPIKDAFLKRKGLTLEDYRILSFDEKEKLQAEWIKSNEFEQLQSRNEDQSTSEGKVVNRSENVTQSESLKETTKAETTSDKKSDGEPTSDNVILSEKSDATIKYNNLIKAIEKLKAENPKEFKKDGTPKSNSKILPSYKALADMATQAYEDSYLERQAQRRKEAKVIADKKDTGLVDGMANIASNSNAAQLFKTAMSKGVFNESEYNQIGTELALLPKDKNGQVDIRDVAEIVQSYFDNTVRPEKNEAQKKETEAINKAFEERQAELSKNLTPEQIQEEKEFDEINRIFAKVQSDETPTKKEIDYVNQNAWIPKGFVFGKNGLEEKSTSDNNVKQSEQKVTAVRQNGKTIIDENGNLTDELPNQFEKLKSEKDFKGLNELYSTVRIFLNGVAQSKGEKTVQQFQKLKKDIEDYANEVKEQSTSDNNINPSKPQPDAFDKAADATIAALNKYKILDTKSTDKKMGFGGDGEKIIRAAFDASRVIYHTTKSLAEAIKKALKTVRDSDWYKNLSGDQKSEIDSLVRKQLNDYAKENVVAEPLEELDLDMQDQAVKDQIMIEAQNLITTEDFKDAKEFSLRLKELYGIKETDAKAIYDKLVDFINVQTEDPFKIALRGKGAVTDHMNNKTINESSEDEIGNRTYLANSFDEMNEDIDAVFGRIKAANPNNWEKIIADKILKKLDERDMQAAIFADRFVTYLNTYLADHQRSPNYTAKALEYKGYRREILARRQKFTQEYATYFAALQQLKINNPLTLIKESGMLTAAERQAAKEMDEKLKGKKEYDASGKKKPFVEDSALDKAAPTSDKKGKSTSDKKDKPPTEKQAKKASRSEVKKNVLNALKNIKNNAADLAIKITKIPC